MGQIKLRDYNMQRTLRGMEWIGQLMVTPWGDSGCTEVDIVRFLYGALRAVDSCLDILTTSSDREDRIFDGKYSPCIT